MNVLNVIKVAVKFIGMDTIKNIKWSDVKKADAPKLAIAVLVAVSGCYGAGVISFTTAQWIVSLAMPIIPMVSSSLQTAGSVSKIEERVNAMENKTTGGDDGSFDTALTD